MYMCIYMYIFLCFQLLLNLVECIRQKGEQEPTSRDVLMRMMEVFVLKFHSIADYQMPDILDKW